MIAPGKYDEQAEKVLQELEARAVILMVVDGRFGTGLSVKSDAAILSTLPQVLRRVADLIEDDVREDVNRAMRWP
jgi:hypothetical protein